MSDGELLKLAARSWELKEAAWEALEDEFDRRHLDLPPPDPVPQIQSPQKRNLVILRKFRDLPEALLAKGMLDSAGVPCFLADDNMVRMDWFISNLLGGVKLLVDAEDFAGASEILNEPIPTDLEFQAADVYAQPRCPKCQSLDINFEELNKPISFGSLFFKFPLPVHRSGWLCHACGHSWQEDSDPALNAPPSPAPPE